MTDNNKFIPFVFQAYSNNSYKELTFYGWAQEGIKSEKCKLLSPNVIDSSLVLSFDSA